MNPANEKSQPYLKFEKKLFLYLLLKLFSPPGDKIDQFDIFLNR